MEMKTCSTADTTLLACLKIAQSFSENIFELAHIRTDWTQEYANDLKARIKSVQINHLQAEFCVETAEHKRAHLLMLTSLKDFNLLRALIRIEFKNEPKFVKMVYDELGFTDLFSDAINGDYHSLYLLIERFYTNMTPQIREKLISKTIPISMIDRALVYYNQIQPYRSCFDMEFENKGITDEGKGKIKEIYSEIKDICRIATAYYMLDPSKRDQFCFFRVLHGMNISIPETIYNK